MEEYYGIQIGRLVEQVGWSPTWPGPALGWDGLGGCPGLPKFWGGQLNSMFINNS
jgi:hypothetical protein